MSRIKKIILWSLLLGSLGCNKVELPPVDDPLPVFTAYAELDNGARFDFSAGIDRYYLFVGTESDSSGKIVYYARYEQLDCLDQCEPSFRIFLKGGENPNPQEPEILQWVFPGALIPFEGASVWVTDTFYSLSLQSTSEWFGNTPVHLWDVGDTTIILNGPQTLTLQRQNPDPLEVCLNLGDPATACQSVQCRQVDFSGQTSCSVQIDPDSMGTLAAIASGTNGQIDYTWVTGEITPSIQVFLPGLYCVTISDADNCQSSHCLEYNNQFDACRAGFVYETEIATDSTLVNTSDQRRVWLEWEQDGILYSTDGWDQPMDAYFEILSMEPFGATNQKVKARFQAVLRDESGLNTLVIQEGEAVFELIVL